MWEIWVQFGRGVRGTFTWICVSMMVLKMWLLVRCFPQGVACEVFSTRGLLQGKCQECLKIRLHISGAAAAAAARHRCSRGGKDGKNGAQRKYEHRVWQQCDPLSWSGKNIQHHHWVLHHKKESCRRIFSVPDFWCHHCHVHPHCCAANRDSQLSAVCSSSARSPPPGHQINIHQWTVGFFVEC